MKVSRVWLERNGRTIFIQGMVHAAPKDFYLKCQKEVDAALVDGYIIFFERVRGSDSFNYSGEDNKAKIALFFKLISTLMPFFASSLKIELQKGNIIYPPHSVNADITFSELVDRIDATGFRCGFLLNSLKQLSDEVLEKKLKERELEDIMKPRRKIWAPVDFLIKILVKIFFRKAQRVLLGFRNSYAIEIIENHGATKSFVHYGEAHVTGMVKILKNKGWQVIRKERCRIINHPL